MDRSAPALVPIVVQVAEPHPAGIVDYAQAQVRAALDHSRGPVLHARVRLTRHPDPAVGQPVTAQATVDVDGRLVHARVRAGTEREAIDLLRDRLRNRMQHDGARHSGSWEDRRGRYSGPADPRAGESHEWRHGDAPTRRPPYFPRPPDERQIIRHKSYALAECGTDEAAFDMDTLDHDFHLFAEIGSGQDSVLYHDGPTGFRLAQLQPDPDGLADHALPVTVSGQPAPVLSTDEAVERMAAVDHPFLFFLDGERGRGAVLYHRYDGHYGLITPADGG